MTFFPFKHSPWKITSRAVVQRRFWQGLRHYWWKKKREILKETGIFFPERLWKQIWFGFFGHSVFRCKKQNRGTIQKITFHDENCRKFAWCIEKFWKRFYLMRLLTFQLFRGPMNWTQPSNIHWFHTKRTKSTDYLREEVQNLSILLKTELKLKINSILKFITALSASHGQVSNNKLHLFFWHRFLLIRSSLFGTWQKKISG